MTWAATRLELAHRKPRADRSNSARLLEIPLSCFMAFSIFVFKMRACYGRRATKQHQFLKAIMPADGTSAAN
jgi:hypothetical protein